MAPKVSVIIPTFNRGEIVVNALESVLAQTYRDYEIIVVDDGSTDNTRHKLSAYRDRIRYVYQENGGASAARNKGLELARGEWISALDSDDTWLPTKLERQFETMAALGNDLGACFTDCEFSGDPGLCQTSFELGGFEKKGSFGVLGNPMRYVLARQPIIWIQSLLVRKSLMDELGRFDGSLVVTQDTDLIFQLALRTRFCFVSEPLVKVDRTPSRQVGLTELLHGSDDKGFLDMEHMYKKWLGLPELVDPATRGQVRELLRGLYYDWMVQKIYQLRFSEMLRKASLLSEVGPSHLEIFLRLAFRAARRMYRSLSPQRRTAY